MRLVYLSPVPWDSAAQRPHFFVDLAKKSGFSEVLWVEPYPGRLPQLKDLRKGYRQDAETSIQRDQGIELFHVRALPMEPLVPIFRLLNRRVLRSAVDTIRAFSEGRDVVLIVGKPSVLALDLIQLMSWQAVVYDAMDDFPAFYSGLSQKHMSRLEHELAAKSDHILCSSEKLISKFRDSGKTELVLNACSEQLKSQFAGVKQSRRRISLIFGYVGTLAEWFDWDSVIALARKLPEARIVLVGPVRSPLPHGLPPNIEIRPPISHKDVPAFLKTLDIGLIPFKLTTLTVAVDPVKYYEYRAAGLQIVTTRFGQMALREQETGLYYFDNVLNNPDALRLPEDVLEQELQGYAITWDVRLMGLFSRLLSGNGIAR